MPAVSSLYNALDARLRCRMNVAVDFTALPLRSPMRRKDYACLPVR